MYLPRFEVEKPGTLQEAADLLKGHSINSILFAGGTDLFPRMKYGLVDAERLISLKNLTVCTPRVLPDGGLMLDGALTLTAVTRSHEVLRNAPLLAAAARKVATHEIRNVATLAGNLCQDTRCLYYNQKHTFQFVKGCFKRGGDSCYFIPKGAKCWAVYMSDTATALSCLRAKLQIISSDGGATLDFEDFYSGDPIKPLTIKPNEIISEIILPPAKEPRGWAYSKLTLREGIEFGALNVAVVLEAENDLKTCSRARITVGSVSSAPLRARQAESSLEGKKFSKTLLSQIARQVSKEVNVIPHHGYSKSYLTEALKVETHDALNRAVARFLGDKQ